MQASGASFFEIMQSAPRHGHSESPYLWVFFFLFRGARIREGKGMPNHTHAHPSHARLIICSWISWISSLLSRILWGACMHACRARREENSRMSDLLPRILRVSAERMKGVWGEVIGDLV